MPRSDDHPHPSQFIVSPLLKALERDADRVVLEMVGGAALTGRALRDAISQYTQLLLMRGGAAGARIALLAPNSAEVVVLQHAVSFAGGCLVSLHAMGSVDDHLFAIEDGQVDVLVYDPAKFEDHVGEILRRTTRIRTLLALGESGLGENLPALATGLAPGPLEIPTARADQMIRLIYSGGTTGKPKAIPGNARTAETAFQIVLSEWDWPTDPRVLAVVPLSHAGATLFLPTLLKHGTMFVMSSFDAGAVLAAIEKYRISAIMLVPTMIYALLDHPDFDTYDLSSLETIFYGASLMSPARLKEGLERLGPVFFQFYGQAEAPMTVMVLRRNEHDADNPLRLASCGRPVSRVDVALLDDDCNPVPDGEPGEICVRGPLVMDGYLDREELNRETFAGGWLHTGDVAVKDPDGFMRIVDRKKDMIVSGGFNVFPSEVENVIASHPAVAQVSVFGIPDAKWGEAVVATVVLRPGPAIAPVELISLVRKHKGPVQAPKYIAFVEALPLTPVGKPDKKAMRQQFMNNRGA